MKIFVFGDSFAANENGWVKTIPGDITNFAENGIGEYKIYKKIMTNLNFDKAIVCHTSPWRVHARRHPIHCKDPNRSNNDFLLNDVEHYSKLNNEMSLVNSYLMKYYDPDYQLDIYKLLVKEIMNLKDTINITFHNREDTDLIQTNFNDIWKTHPGEINHMSAEGNEIISKKVQELL
jgi:hypothetical protein